MHAASSSVILTKINDCKNSRKRKSQELNKAQKQPKIESYAKPSQQVVSQLVLNFVCDALVPFSTVNNPSFRALMTLAFPDINILDRRSLSEKIKAEYTLTKDSMRKQFERLDYICVTADCWTSHKRSFLGMTAHWINQSSFKRESASIACKGISGSHKNEVLTKHIEEILDEFNILSKVCKIVTDNEPAICLAANMVQYNEEICFSAATEDNTEGIEMSRIDLTDVLDQELSFRLPIHQRCGAHKINLNMNADIEKFRNILTKPICDTTDEGFSVQLGINYFHVFDKVMEKCKSLWNKQQRSPLVAGMIKENLGVYFEVGNSTRWNSILNAFKHLMTCIQKHPNKVQTIFKQLKLTELTEIDTEFIQTYISVSNIFLLFSFALHWKKKTSPKLQSYLLDQQNHNCKVKRPALDKIWTSKV